MNDEHAHFLAGAIVNLVHEMQKTREQSVIDLEWRKLHSEFATKHDLEHWSNKIMSAISDYSAKVDAAFTEVGTSVDEIVASVAGVSGDVASLKDIILKLQNNPGPISPEDQALLDTGVTKVTAVSDRLKSVSAALKELDAATEGTIVEPPPV
jgi:hypothetical protein